MKTQADKARDLQKHTIQRIKQEPSSGGDATLADNRPATVVQRKLKSGIERSEPTKGTIQQKTTEPGRNNNTGLPDHLKSGIENLLKRMVPEVEEVEAEGV